MIASDSFRWLSQPDLDVDAYALFDRKTGEPAGWYLFAIIKSPELADDSDELLGRVKDFDRGPVRVIARVLKTPGASRALPPIPADSPANSPIDVWTRESGAWFRLETSAVLNPGLFPDQRLNRDDLVERIQKSKGRILNLFSYTGAFSLVALAAGASEAVSVDISRRYQQWERANFDATFEDETKPALRSICEDSATYLNRCVKRGEKFETIIIDPPTFARGTGGKTFRVKKDLPVLSEVAVACLAPGGTLFVSTNDADWSGRDFYTWAREFAKRENLKLTPGRTPEDFGPGHPLKSVWFEAG